MLKIAEGDHLKVCRGFYWHHGIAVDEDMVISNTTTGVVRQTLSEFSAGAQVYKVMHVRKPWRTYWPPEVVAFAATMCYLEHAELGSHADGRTYNVITWNCEHFAHFCLFGKRASLQVGSACAVALCTAAIATFSPLGATAFLSLAVAGVGTPLGAGVSLALAAHGGRVRYSVPATPAVHNFSRLASRAQQRHMGST